MDPLPTKARRFVLHLFEWRGIEIPTQEWFDERVPKDDPCGTTYYSLLDLQGRASIYRPNSPRNIWDMLPVHLHIVMALIAGCANHQLSLVHPINCRGCEVCERSDRLTRLLAADSQFKAWNELYGEEALLEGRGVEEQENVPVVCQDALREVRQEVDTQEPYARLRHLPAEYDSSEWDLDPSRM